MADTLTLYLPSPWDPTSASDWMVHHAGWSIANLPYPVDLVGEAGCRVWLEHGDEDTVSIGQRLGGFTPPMSIAFEPYDRAKRGHRHVLDTVLSLAARSSAVLLLYDDDDVLLRASNGRIMVPAEARAWWTSWGIEDFLS